MGTGPDPGHRSVRLSVIRQEMQNKKKLRYRGDYSEWFAWRTAVRAVMVEMHIIGVVDQPAPTIEMIRQIFTSSSPEQQEQKLDHALFEHGIQLTEYYHILYESIIFDGPMPVQDKAYFAHTFEYPNAGLADGKSLNRHLEDKAAASIKEKQSAYRVAAYNPSVLPLTSTLSQKCFHQAFINPASMLVILHQKYAT